MFDILRILPITVFFTENALVAFVVYPLRILIDSRMAFAMRVWEQVACVIRDGF